MKTVELFGSWKPMCFNCCGQLLHLDPLPETIAAMRELVSRERRKGDRRVGRADTRVFQYERRVGDRRTPRTAEGSGPLTAVPVEIGFDDLYDDVVIEIGLEDLELVEEVRVEEAMAFEDVTRIRELVQDLRPADFPLPPATLAVR